MSKDFRSKTFQKVLRGYAPEEVAEYLTYVNSEYQKLERRCGENERKLTIALSKLDAVSTRLKETEENELSAAASEDALKSADDIIAEAKQKADEMLADAKAKSARMMSDASDRARQMLEGAAGKAESILREADAEGRQLKTDSRTLCQTSEKLYGEVCRFRDTLFDLYNTHIELIEQTVGEAGEYYEKIRGASGRQTVPTAAPAVTEEKSVTAADAANEPIETEETEETFSAFDSAIEERHAVLAESGAIEAILADEWTLPVEEAADEEPEAIEEPEVIKEPPQEPDDDFEIELFDEEDNGADEPKSDADFVAGLFADEEENTNRPQADDDFVAELFADEENDADRSEEAADDAPAGTESAEAEEAEAPAAPKDVFIDLEDGNDWNALAETADPKLAEDFNEPTEPDEKADEEPIDIDDLTPEELSELLLNRLMNEPVENPAPEEEEPEAVKTFDELLALKPEDISSELLDSVFGETKKYVEVVSSQPTYTPEEPKKKKSIL